MRCPNCQTINPPQARFCMECGLRLLVCPNCQTVNFPQAKFCIECGTALAAQPRDERRTVPLSEVGAQGQFTTPVLPAVVANGRSFATGNPAASQLSEPEERRVVTVMFADITGSTPLADRLDPEDMRTILAGYFNLMAEQIRRHGGTVDKYIGHAVIAVLCAPPSPQRPPARPVPPPPGMANPAQKLNRVRHG